MFERLSTAIMKRATLAAILGGSLVAQAVAAQTPPPINEEQHINDSLLAAAVGAMILRDCSTIFPRYLVIKGKVDALEEYALGQGYTEEQIEAFLDDKDERKRMRKLANTYLRDHGVVKDDPETFCALGRDEIAKGTLTGEMIWSLK